MTLMLVVVFVADEGDDNEADGASERDANRLPVSTIKASDRGMVGDAQC